MEVNEKIKKAIRNYMADHGLTAMDLGRQLGLANSTVSRWISSAGRTTGTIRPATWQRLEPLIKPYLHQVNPEFIAIRDQPEQQYRTRRDQDPITQAMLAYWHRLGDDQKIELLKTAKQMTEKPPGCVNSA